VNERTENIGARRLSTVMERLLDDVSFDAAHRAGQTITVDAAYVDSAPAGAVARTKTCRATSCKITNTF
jgi:ATP-dependent protease HslVU (ClpYQ) ATPase subunit